MQEVEEFLSIFGKAVARQAKEKKVALLFSAGIDSSLLALQLKRLGKEIHCYITSAGNAKDLVASEKFCEKFSLKLRHADVSMQQLEEKLPEIVKLIGSESPVEVGIAATLFFSLQAARKDGFRKVFLGQGADELFAGYAKMRGCKNLNAECKKLFSGLPKTLRRREEKIAKKLGLKLAMPFMEREVAEFALRLPGRFKLHKGVNKVLLRQALLEIGAGNEVALRKKTAMQYGSGIDRALEKIAKAKRMKKSEYLHMLAGSA